LDADRFDQLIRSLTSSEGLPAPRSRRSLVAILGGLGAAITAAVRGDSEAALAKRRRKRKKRKRGGAAPPAPRPPECAVTADCPELTESCQGDQCEPVCTAQTCSGADCNCAVEHEDDGARSAVCYSRFLTDNQQCADEPNVCSHPFPRCLIQDDQTNCPTCAVCAAIEPCSCESNGDCYDMTFSCQGGQCKPVCTAESCPGDNCFCAVHVDNGERMPVCYGTITASEIPCGGDSDCARTPGSSCLIREDHSASCPTSFCTDCSIITTCPP